MAGLHALPRPVAVVVGAGGVLGAAHRTRLRHREVYPLGQPPSRAGVFTDRGLRRLIARAELPSRIEELAVPFTAVAMDLDTAEPALPDHGDLESALPAGAAIPGMLPPVERAGIEAWPAPWDFGHSRRLISTASRTAGRLPDGLRVGGPGLYRLDALSATPPDPGGASSSSSVGEAGL